MEDGLFSGQGVKLGMIGRGEGREGVFRMESRGALHAGELRHCYS